MSVVFSTDFNEFSANSTPSNFTDYFSRGASFTVKDTLPFSSPISSKRLAISTVNSANNVIVITDAGQAGDVDILARFRDDATNTWTNVAMVCARVSGTQGSENFYWFDVGGDYISMGKVVNGVSTTFFTYYNNGYSADREFWVRFKISGSNLYGKFWSTKSEEPADWKATRTDTSLASGYSGIGSKNQYVPISCDYVAVSTDGLQPKYPPKDFATDSFKLFGKLSNLPSDPFSTVRFSGGTFVSPNKRFTGIKVRASSPSGAGLRAAIYSGGSLSTGPAGATLLHDFGIITAPVSSSDITASCQNIDIPVNQPLWVAFKQDAACTAAYSVNMAGNGDFKSSSGWYEVTGAQISQSTSELFPDTVPATTGAFSSTRSLAAEIILVQAVLDARSMAVSSASSASISALGNLSADSHAVSLCSPVDTALSDIVLQGASAAATSTSSITTQRQAEVSAASAAASSASNIELGNISDLLALSQGVSLAAPIDTDQLTMVSGLAAATSMTQGAAVVTSFTQCGSAAVSFSSGASAAVVSPIVVSCEAATGASSPETMMIGDLSALSASRSASGEPLSFSDAFLAGGSRAVTLSGVVNCVVSSGVVASSPAASSALPISVTVFEYRSPTATAGAYSELAQVEGVVTVSFGADSFAHSESNASLAYSDCYLSVESGAASESSEIGPLLIQMASLTDNGSFIKHAPNKAFVRGGTNKAFVKEAPLFTFERPAN